MFDIRSGPHVVLCKTSLARFLQKKSREQTSSRKMTRRIETINWHVRGLNVSALENNMAMLHQLDVIILLSWPATQASKHATEDPCKNCVCSTLIGLADLWNRVQVEIDTHNCVTGGMQEAVEEISSQAKRMCMYLWQTSRVVFQTCSIRLSC